MAGKLKRGLEATMAMAWVMTSTAIMCIVFLLVIWGVRILLHRGAVEFLGPICTMILVFLTMSVLGVTWPGTEAFYRSHLIDKIDFLNRNLGLCFTIPLIMINRERRLDSAAISKIIAASITTNIICWPMVFLVASAWQLLFSGIPIFAMADAWPGFGAFLDKSPVQRQGGQRPSRGLCPGSHLLGILDPPATAARSISSGSTASVKTTSRVGGCPMPFAPTLDVTIAYPSSASSIENNGHLNHNSTRTGDAPAGAGPRLSPRISSLEMACNLDIMSYGIMSMLTAASRYLIVRLPSPAHKPGLIGRMTSFLSSQRYLVLALLFILLLGLPLAATIKEDRLLDFGFLCLFWICTNELQVSLRPAGDWTTRRGGLYIVASLFATLINPVLSTTGFMIGYVQIKAKVRGDPSSRDTLAVFSSGTSVSALLSYHVGIAGLPEGKSDWFGAGDVALALLECGIVAWGFKLYECRHQLASRAGLAAVLTSACAALFNLYVSILVARHGIRLPRSEALAFAARSTTLALSRPAMEALGGNMMVNAAVVVSNGIIGQWIYPFMPRLIGVPYDEDYRNTTSTKTTSGPHDLEHAQDAQQSSPQGISTAPSDRDRHENGKYNQDKHRDGPMISAAGVTVGVNGAAMGVAYLYAHRASSAPFAALTMTIFGVMTVIFTCMGPFPHIIQGLAA